MVFVFLLLTSLRGRRSGSTREVIFLFDEPASNLHATAQEQLLQSLERLSENARIIYTTHSHHLINPAWLDATYVVMNQAVQPGGDTLETTARETDIQLSSYRSFAARHPEQSEYFKPILDVLEYRPSRPELVPSLALVEGKNDFYTLRLGEIALGEGFVHTYPGGGAGSLDAPIALYISQAREFVCLLDGDAEGVAQKKRYLARFGEILSGRVMTLSDLLPELKGKSLEEVFEKSDKQVICEAIFGEGIIVNKKNLNRAVQQLVATNSCPELHAETRERFRTILTGLRNRLDDLKSREHGKDRTT